MDQYTIKDFGKIIKKNAQSQRHELLANGTDVFRIYDRNQEDFPVSVDLYSTYARVQVYSDEEFSPSVVETITDQINRMAYVDRDKIIFSYRAKRDKGQQHEKTNLEPVIVNVHENGLVFKTDLTSYADTGLFLDHINTRSMIKEMSAGLNVLNLFSYTGSFSVYAASGRAASVTSVDMSTTYSKWAEENLKANGFEGDNYKCICCDATKFVREEIEKNHRYDIIIFDPPAFSNSHKMDEDFDVQRDFYEWIRNLRSILTKNGLIMFSTNLGSFKIDKRRLRGFNVKETTKQLWAEGFVKGRKGTTRSWVMALDDNSLTLDWSEDRTEKKSVSEKKEYRPRRNDGERRFNDRRRDDRDRRDHRDFHDRRERRDFGGERKEYGERRSYGEHKSYGEHRSYGERRSYGEHNEGRGDRDFKPRSDRRFNDEHRDYRERRSFDDNRERRDFRSRDDRPRYDRNDRDRDNRRRSASSSPDYENKHRYTERKDTKPRKPYGYDSFKPARSRDDSSDFFWNED